jgi:exodeoxyribonuclease VII small subunit
MTNISFEKALADLEQTVAKLEQGGIPLNESLALFEKGVKLARFLRGELDKAERKVEILLKDEKGGVRTREFDLDKETGERRGSGDSDEIADGTGGEPVDEDEPVEK